MVYTQFFINLFIYLDGPPIVSPLLYTNYEEQQYTEVLTLLELAVTKETPILMGDFNNGPGSPGHVWSNPFHYSLITARGLVSPYVLKDGRCTSCGDNPSRVVSGFRENRSLDHIYITTDAYEGRVISSTVKILLANTKCKI